jgi:hypothetical protein
VAGTLAEHGIALFAISYDAVEILKGFTDKHGIAYPLLSDAGSHVMRRLGLLNAHVQDDHAAYGIKPNPRHVDLPYPGVFVLDADGVVTDKRFHESYRERDSGAGLLAVALGIAAPPPLAAASSASGDVVRVRAWLDSETYAWFQRIHCFAEIAITPGFHVAGSPAADGMVPVALDVAPLDGLEVGAVTWPAPTPLRLQGRDADLLAHEGTIRGSLPLTFTAAPGAGDHRLRLTVTYQACDSTSCLPPSSITLELPIREAALVDRTLPAADAKTP